MSRLTDALAAWIRDPWHSADVQRMHRRAQAAEARAERAEVRAGELLEAFDEVLALALLHPGDTQRIVERLAKCARKADTSA